jgi:hypothetical protein
MKRFLIPSRTTITLLVLVAFVARSVTPASAAPQIRLNKWGGTIDFSATGVSSFTLAGTSSHLGKFTAYGEVEFVPGDNGMLVGTGVAVFTAADGSLLVGHVQWDAEEAVDGCRTSAVHFSWADSVEFSDGTVVESSGRFAEAERRPPGLVVIAIIAILIGLLKPAVETVR